MAAVATGLQVKGLAEFQRSLGRLSPEAKKQLRTATKKAGDRVKSGAAAKVPKKTGRAARSLTSKAKGDGVLVTGGSSRAEYYPWLDFGGTVGRGRRSTTTVTLYTDRTGKVRIRQGAVRRSGKTGSAVRPFIKGGRYLYPTLKQVRPQIRDDLERAVKDACRSVGLEVKS